MESPLQEHGSYDMYILNQTLIIEAVDAWNLETSLRFGQEFKELVNKIEHNPWACLVNLNDFELAIPEVWEHVNKINEWANLHNQKYEVVVCSSLIQEVLLEISHKKLSNVETNFCENVEQAKKWLNQFGVI
ncbi:MAG: hypothetical protein ACJAV1_003670 [Paraglaciecola sp.]